MLDMQLTEETMSHAQICSIKREFLNLQERMELAKVNLDNDRNLDSQKKSVKLNILNEARILSGEILEAHDKKADCLCFLDHENKGSCQETDNLGMFTHLETLKKLLGQLDHQLMDTGQPDAAARIPTTKLNPLSKCFIPSAKVFELIEKSVPKEIPRAIECTKSVVSQNEFSNSHSIFLLGKFLCTRENCGYESEYRLKSNVRNLWPHTKEIANAQVHFPCLLTCLYGLNRHATAMCPTMRLPHRPHKFTSLWSVSVEDRKLWNKSTVREPCDCPPSFGYNVPPEMFGNPLNYETYCNETGIHVSYYDAPVCDEFYDCKSVNIHEMSCMQLENYDNLFSTNEYLGTDEDRTMRLHEYKKSFERFIEEICSITRAVEKMTDPKSFGTCSEINKNTRIQTSQPENQRNENCLLPVTNGNFETASTRSDTSGKNVIIQTKETESRRKLSKPEDTSELPPRRLTCDPPCSIWCDSKLDHNKQEISEWKFTEPIDKNCTLRKNRSQDNLSSYDLVARVVNLASTQKPGCLKTHGLPFKETSTIFDTEQWNSWKLAEFRLRRDSGDSGYSTVSSCGSQTDHEVTTSYKGDSSCNDDLSRMGYDKDYWTPLPDCKPPCNKGNSLKNTLYHNWSVESRPIKQRRLRQRNGFLNIRDGTETALKNQKFQNLLEHDGKKWKGYEHEFPALKRCKI